MALVIDLSLMLPRFDLMSSSSSAGLTKWNTLSSSSRAFPRWKKNCFPPLFMLSFTALQLFKSWQIGGCLSAEFECRQKKWNCTGYCEMWGKKHNSKIFYIKQHLLACIIRAGFLTKAQEEKTSDKLCITKQWWDQCVCPYVLHGSLGFGRSSAECGAAWIKLTWHYLAPERKKGLLSDKVPQSTSHTITFVETETEVTRAFFRVLELNYNQ